MLSFVPHFNFSCSACSSNRVAGRLEQLNLNTQAQSVCLGVDAQLLLVATTSDVGRWLFGSCC